MMSFEELWENINKIVASSESKQEKKDPLKEEVIEKMKGEDPNVYMKGGSKRKTIEQTAAVVFKHTNIFQYMKEAETMVGRNTDMPAAYNSFEREVTIRTLELHRDYLEAIKHSPFFDEFMREIMKEVIKGRS